MRKIFFIFMTIAGVYLLNSCADNSTREPVSDSGKILQHPDGTISLNLDNADCYANIDDRSDNTAEWNVVVSKSGRYNVWITSATLDTTDLKYKNPVMVNIQDKMIQAKPDCDKIIANSSEVPKPYFRADSFIGSLYLQDTGQFYVQVTSEMILPKEFANLSSAEDIAKLISVSFTPVPVR